MPRSTLTKPVFFIILFLTTFLISTNKVYAQTDSAADSTEFSRNTIFLELLGNAGLYSINFEHRFVSSLGFVSVSRG